MEKEKAEIASLVEKYGRIQSLMKYVNSDTLKKSYSKQPKGKAVGVDGVTKEEYGENLEENIENLRQLIQAGLAQKTTDRRNVLFRILQ